MFYILLSLYVATTSGGLIALKLGSTQGAIVAFSNGHLVFNFSLFNIVGVILYAASFFLYTYLIAKNDLGFIIPLTTALVYIVIFAASFILFKEPFSMTKIIAIALILAGVILLNSKA